MDYLLSYFLIIFVFFSSSICGQFSYERSILLEFKELVSDPHGILRSWNAANSNHCSWLGISCNSNLRVSEIKIESNLSFSIGVLGGKLPSMLGNLTHLRVLSLPYNEFEGKIPNEILELKNLEVLNLEGNLLAGDFSGYRFHGLTKLRVLNLAFNRIFGEFPSSLAKCESLKILNMAGNNVSGVVPLFLGQWKEMRVLNLSYNRLIGCKKSYSGYGCGNLEHLDLSANFLKGEIPRALGKCRHLKTLLLSFNALSGYIPDDLGKLRSLEVLDVSRNKLRGPIPASLGSCSNLSVLVLSSNFNDYQAMGHPRGDGFICAAKRDCNSFEGSIPEAITALPAMKIIWAPGANLYGEFPSKWGSCNSLLMHDQRNPVELLHSPKTRRSLAVAASLFSLTAIGAIAIAFLIAYCCSRKPTVSSTTTETAAVAVVVAPPPPPPPSAKKLTVFVDVGMQLSYEAILEATSNFSRRNCIGRGGFGSTYKAEVAPGSIVAVKRLATERHQGEGGARQFQAEVNTLGRIKHPNLITLIGYYSGESEMFLIYNYLAGGNLDRFIRDRDRLCFNWEILHKIALQIGSALSFLHNQCNPRILHRDIKPSNILLDGEYNAYLSDFGLSKILSPEKTHATTHVAGTYGYIAPEYAQTGRVSNKSDVYSYGLVLLELISDKRVLDPSFYTHDDGFNISSWAMMMMNEGKTKDVFTAGLWETGPKDKLVKLLHVAVLCTVQALAARPSMKRVVQRLRQLKPAAG
ncbi:probable LRR receptor-like serine/threonine-protein kinase RPK1 [Andrographis paniculata]|uniref:probable LRR receptor-like serine/threonine-protein kinase RPK1 n=1 Tax=Andrographis paniculata TaxID=175694 RepID=UPI0021E7C298|nr:probable LRR receptor-like serine/threonine-protein kinase RPK1 [Andrographis paniculata]